MIRPAKCSDARPIATIYNHYIEHSVITFEEHPVSEADISQRICQSAACNLPWLVAETDSQIIGYAYASPWHNRSAYRFTVEASVYLSADAVSGGWGTQLYQALFAYLKAQQIHTVIGCIALPNPASIALHEKLGMVQIGHFKEVGYKFGKWVDVGYWQKVLNN